MLTKVTLLVLVTVPIGGIYIFKHPKFGIYSAIALSSVLVTTDLPIVGTKLAIPDLAIIFTLIGLAYRLARRGILFPSAQNPSVKRAEIFCLIFVLVVWVSFLCKGIVFNDRITYSFVEALTYTYCFVLMLSTRILINKWGDLSRCIMAWSLGVALVCAVSVIAQYYSFGWAYSLSGKLKATFKAPNQLPSYVIPFSSIPIYSIFMSKISNQRKIYLLILFILVIFSALENGSRSGLLMLVASIVITPLTAIRGIRKKILFYVSFAAILVLLLFAMSPEHLMGLLQAVEFPTIRRVVELGIVGETGNLDPRITQVKTVLSNIWKNPLLGVGPAKFQALTKSSHEVHNTYFGVLFGSGILGFIALVCSIYYILKSGIVTYLRKYKNIKVGIFVALVISFLLILIYGFAHFGLRQRIYWLLAGLILSGSEILHQSRPSDYN